MNRPREACLPWAVVLSVPRDDDGLPTDMRREAATMECVRLKSSAIGPVPSTSTRPAPQPTACLPLFSAGHGYSP